ncbi:MAG: pyridoxine 5'-phosphate synthase [bacterium]|nr:pyridoxine 5'-phosphate synthase [bacterium]
MKLGVNIDHVATLRQARGEEEPDLIQAAKEALAAGADGITIHLREDRRHIQDKDVHKLAGFVPRLNLEMAATDEMLSIAADIKPMFCCLVPEKREELTTEGGLDVISNQSNLQTAVNRLKSAGIKVSIFIDPDFDQISAARKINTDYIEIHTGRYANAANHTQRQELKKIKEAAAYAAGINLKVNAGHGLKYFNTAPIAQIPDIEELNIGHSIICRSLFTGIKQAVYEMISIINKRN